MMNEDKTALLLTEHGIRPTANRIIVARELATSTRPLSLSELEQRIMSIDKSGIFRALSLFRKQHMVHCIENEGEGLRYEICRSNDEVDGDLHVHFYCELCRQTICLNEIPVPSVEIPAGFLPTSASYIIKGICPQCSQRKSECCLA